MPNTQEQEQGRKMQDTSQQLGQEQIAQEADTFIKHAMNMLNDEKVGPSIVELALSKPDPLDSISDAVVLLFQRVDEASRKSGVEISDAVRLSAVQEVIGEVVNVVVSTGELDEPEEGDLELVLAVTVEKYIKKEIDAGRIDPKKLAGEMQQTLDSMSEEEKEAVIAQMEGMNERVKERAKSRPKMSPKAIGATKREVEQQQGRGAQENQKTYNTQSALGGM